jgi:hypothetical protein
MIKLVVLGEVFKRIRGSGAKQGAAHSGLQIVPGDLAMAACANSRVDVVVPLVSLGGM